MVSKIISLRGNSIAANKLLQLGISFAVCVVVVVVFARFSPGPNLLRKLCANLADAFEHCKMFSKTLSLCCATLEPHKKKQQQQQLRVDCKNYELRGIIVYKKNIFKSLKTFRNFNFLPECFLYYYFLFV